MSGARDIPKDRRQVLIVDDDESIRSTLAFYFEQEGYVVETAEDGEHALEHFEVGRFCLMTLDYQMPGMNGLEIASLIHKQDRDVAIALVTGTTHTLENNDLVLTGIAKVFSKPIDLCEVSAWLRSLSNPG